MSKKKKETKEEKALWYTGYNYFRKGEYEKAKKFFNEAINKQNDETGYLMMGILNNKLKKYNEAIENFNKYAESSDKNKSIAYGYKGFAKLKLGFYRDAFSDFISAIEQKISEKEEKLTNLKKAFLVTTEKFETVKFATKEKMVSIDRINKKINKCFKDCIVFINDNNFKKAIECMQKLVQMYPKPATPESTIENKENK